MWLGVIVLAGTPSHAMQWPVVAAVPRFMCCRPVSAPSWVTGFVVTVFDGPLRNTACAILVRVSALVQAGHGRLTDSFTWASRQPPVQEPERARGRPAPSGRRVSASAAI